MTFQRKRDEYNNNKRLERDISGTQSEKTRFNV